MSCVTPGGLLAPGAYRAAGLTSGDVIEAMLRVQVAWKCRLADRRGASCGC